MSETRRLERADLVSIFDRPGALDNDQFAARWFSTEAQSVLTAMVAQLKAKNA